VFHNKGAGNGNGICHCPNNRRSTKRSHMGRQQAGAAAGFNVRLTAIRKDNAFETETSTLGCCGGYYTATSVPWM